MIQPLPHEKGFTVSWDQFHRDARALAWRLESAQTPDKQWKKIIAITRGGLVPAMIVARELDLRIVDSISIHSYDNQEQSEPRIIKRAQLGDSSDTLIIDDLVDSGRTLALVRESYRQAHYGTVYAKPKGRPFVDTYITEVSQDTWIYFPWDTALQYVGPYKEQPI